MSEAATSFQSLNLVPRLGDNAFGLKDPSRLFDTKFTLEGNHNQAVIGIRTEKRHLEAQLPWDSRSQLQISQEDRYLLVLDVDFATTAKLRRDQVEISEWITSSHRIVKKTIEREFLK